MQEKSSPSEVKTKFLDYDARRDPKTDHFCIKCQQDLDPKKAKRIVLLAGIMVIHPSYYGLALSRKDFQHEIWPVGLDCAKKIGMEWTVNYELGLATNKHYGRILRHMNDNDGFLSITEAIQYKSEVYDLSKLGLIHSGSHAGMDGYVLT